MNVGELPFRRIESYPAMATASGVLCRLLDGLGFRYYWATEGLRNADLLFRPTSESMSLGELLRHVYGLVFWVGEHFQASAESEAAGRLAADLSLRPSTLKLLAKLRERVAQSSDEQIAGIEVVGRGKDVPLPFWHLVNGPLADALTHVGQINSWRRINGNPSPRANVFLGQPPSDRPDRDGRHATG